MRFMPWAARVSVLECRASGRPSCALLVGLLDALRSSGIADLSACAVTGERDALAYVSPKSGRAVSRSAGAGYHDKLLRLPGFMLSSQGGLAEGDVAAGLKLTGFFLARHVFHPHDKPLPDIRLRLAEVLAAG